MENNSKAWIDWMCKKHVIVAWILFPVISFSQEMLGVVNSNFEGVNTAMINPANTVGSEQILNINLLAGDFFVSSNYIYLHRKDYGFFKIFKVNITSPQYLYIYPYPQIQYDDSVYYYDYFKNSKPRDLYFNTRIVGPSVMYHWGKNAFSFVTGFRSVASAEHIPNDIANFIYRGQEFRPQHNETYTHGWSRFAALSWIESGLGYSRMVFESSYHEINAGIMAKGLLGISAAYGLIDNVTYMIPNADSIYAYKFNGRFGSALPINAADNSPALAPLIKGLGWSFDVGIMYVKYKDPSRQIKAVSTWLQGIEKPYLLKAGISLLDVGMIKFNKNVIVNEYDNVNNRSWGGLLTFKPTTLQQVFRAASYNFLGDSLASQTSQTSFVIWLPSALSFQVDYNAGNNLFVNANAMYGVRFAQLSVRRPSLISLTPRYETKYFEVNMPFSIFDFRDPQIGLAIRIFGLVVGTEKLGTFFHLTDMNGMDVYFALSYNLRPHTKTKKCDTFEDYKRYRVK